MVKKLRMGDKRGCFQNITSIQLGETKVKSQYIRDMEGTLLQYKLYIWEGWKQVSRSLLNA